MMIAFWGAVVWLVYLFIGYPLLLLALRPLRRVRSQPADDFLPAVSVLIAAHNEEKDIGWKVAETLDWDYPEERLEVLVASDASTDGTDEIVQGLAGTRVKLVRLPRGGKQRALNQLASMAKGDLLFFTDANAHIPAHCLRAMTRHFADPKVGCVTGDSHAIEEQETITLAKGANDYWRVENSIKLLEHSLGSVLACDGAIFCARAELFEPLSPDLANDLETPARIAHAGYWIFCEPQAVVFERESKSPIQEFARRRRMCAQGLLAMWRLRHTLLGLRGWQFISHKFLRWLTLIPLLTILVTSIFLAPHSAFFALVALAAILFFLLAFIGLGMAVKGSNGGRLLSLPFYVVLGSLGALVGVLEAFCGRRFDVWDIPTMSRGRLTVQESYGSTPKS
jgi:cellulose synthase/poly-beta-1,6-N-acetylglucosamine synthase-like glycosyltransferase